MTLKLMQALIPILVFCYPVYQSTSKGQQKVVGFIFSSVSKQAGLNKQT